jgi:hypothetical protein
MRFVTLLGLVLMGAEAADAQTSQVHGVWKLNLSASDVPDWLPVQADMTSYSLQDDGNLVALSIRTVNGPPDLPNTGARGERRDYPEYSSASLLEQVVDEEEGRFTYSETAADERTVNILGKANGEVVSRGTRQVSADGETMTIDVVLMQGDQQLPIVLIFDRA